MGLTAIHKHLISFEMTFNQIDRSSQIQHVISLGGIACPKGKFHRPSWTLHIAALPFSTQHSSQKPTGSQNLRDRCKQMEAANRKSLRMAVLTCLATLDSYSALAHAMRGLQATKRATTTAVLRTSICHL